MRAVLVFADGHTELRDDCSGALWWVNGGPDDRQHLRMDAEACGLFVYVQRPADEFEAHIAETSARHAEAGACPS